MYVLLLIIVSCVSHDRKDVVENYSYFTKECTPVNYNMTTMGLPPVTFADNSHRLVILLKCGYFGEISRLSLLEISNYPRNTTIRYQWAYHLPHFKSDVSLSVACIGYLVIRHDRQYRPKQSGLNCLVEEYLFYDLFNNIEIFLHQNYIYFLI
jgi:hypothetical protein